VPLSSPPWTLAAIHSTAGSEAAMRAASRSLVRGSISFAALARTAARPVLVMRSGRPTIA